MKIGLIIGLSGTAAGGERPANRWEDLLDQVRAAEDAGFDLVVFEDDLLLEYGGEPMGAWESVAIAGAIAASTSRMEFGHSVINMPYRSPAMLAKIALTLDEISGGRYSFGIGAGNTPDSDYEAFGFPKDKRYSRFAEAIQVIHALLKTGQVTFEGQFHHHRNARTILDRVRPQGPPIIIAAGGDKMLRLAAEYGDGWNWWSSGDLSDYRVISQRFEQACIDVGRDPGDVVRSLDMYTFDPQGRWDGGERGAPRFGSTVEAMVESIATAKAMGVGEVRCNLFTPAGERRAESVSAMADVVAASKAL